MADGAPVLIEAAEQALADIKHWRQGPASQSTARAALALPSASSPLRAISMGSAERSPQSPGECSVDREVDALFIPHNTLPGAVQAPCMLGDNLTPDTASLQSPHHAMEPAPWAPQGVQELKEAPQPLQAKPAQASEPPRSVGSVRSENAEKPQSKVGPPPGVDLGDGEIAGYRLRAIFDRLDVRGRGEVSKAQIVKALRADSEVRALLQLPAAIRQASPAHTDFEMLFQTIDADNDNKITWSEFRDAYFACTHSNFRAREAPQFEYQGHSFRATPSMVLSKGHSYKLKDGKPAPQQAENSVAPPQPTAAHCTVNAGLELPETAPQVQLLTGKPCDASPLREVNPTESWEVTAASTMPLYADPTDANVSAGDLITSPLTDNDVSGPLRPIALRLGEAPTQQPHGVFVPVRLNSEAPQVTSDTSTPTMWSESLQLTQNTVLAGASHGPLVPVSQALRASPAPEQAASERGVAVSASHGSQTSRTTSPSGGGGDEPYIIAGILSRALRAGGAGVLSALGAVRDAPHWEQVVEFFKVCYSACHGGDVEAALHATLDAEALAAACNALAAVGVALATSTDKTCYDGVDLTPLDAPAASPMRKCSVASAAADVMSVQASSPSVQNTFVSGPSVPYAAPASSTDIAVKDVFETVASAPRASEPTISPPPVSEAVQEERRRRAESYYQRLHRSVSVTGTLEKCEVILANTEMLLAMSSLKQAGGAAASPPVTKSTEGLAAAQRVASPPRALPVPQHVLQHVHQQNEERKVTDRMLEAHLEHRFGTSVFTRANEVLRQSSSLLCGEPYSREHAPRHGSPNRALLSPVPPEVSPTPAPAPAGPPPPVITADDTTPAPAPAGPPPPVITADDTTPAPVRGRAAEAPKQQRLQARTRSLSRAGTSELLNTSVML
eukprot:TRINITY_DN7760_c0_g1_i1.p1 TRINITY_DN7760_c0_g1~~TRINITY_DN7760_c0_g1_i1.p1  ORF type:complete len:903 (+),score=121.36 TRINITY_DN7760_c0_g1_i1:41-2749(+)